MRVREARAEEREQWNQLVLASPQGSFLQTWEWGEVQKAMGWRVWRVVVEEKGEWLMVLLLVRRELPLGRCWLYGPGGPITKFQISNFKFQKTFQTLQEEIERLANMEGAVWARVDAPYVDGSEPGAIWRDTLEEVGWEKSDREVQPATTLLLDLNKSEEELLNNLKSKTRYNVRLAERKGVTVRFSRTREDVDVFWELAQAVAERSGFSYHPKKYYEVMLRTLEAELAIAEYEGEPLAAHLMVYAGERATYAHGASSSSKRDLMAPSLLYWETIRRAKERGCAEYDMWGVAPAGADTDHPWAGVTRMKTGFGGRRVPYVGAYDLVIQPWLHHMMAVARRVRKGWL